MANACFDVPIRVLLMMKFVESTSTVSGQHVSACSRTSSGANTAIHSATKDPLGWIPPCSPRPAVDLARAAASV